MAKQFEYQVCQVQFTRASFANGVWQGNVKPNEPKVIESCTATWDYLNRAGQDGWELFGAVKMTGGDGNNFQQLYLKREKS